MTDIELLQVERDALAFLGLMAFAYTRFDVPVDFPNEAAPSHVLGLNIFATILDNGDGEVLALDRNSIHSDGSPLQHAEQRALRTAIARVSVKRSRKPDQAIEGYYRSSMFLGPGTTPADFFNAGATLYTTLEPCPMCASTALVARVKRVVYLLPDEKYGGYWSIIKDGVIRDGVIIKEGAYKADPLTYGRLAFPDDEAASPLVREVAELFNRLSIKAAEQIIQKTRATHLLDFCRDELAQAFAILHRLKATDLITIDGETRNQTTLAHFKRFTGMPTI